MKRVSTKLKLIALLLVVTTVGGYTILSPYFGMGGKFDNNYNADDSKENFYNNQKTIYELRDYFSSILPDRKGVSFGFHERNDRFYFIIREIDINGNFKFITEENAQINSERLNDIIEKIGWTNKELEILLSKLIAANCIGIFKQPYSDEPVDITFRYGGSSGVAMYSYYLFGNPFYDNVVKKYARKEGVVQLNDSTLFEAGYPL